MLKTLFKTPSALISGLVLALVLAAAVFAPWLSPYDASDLAAFDIADANMGATSSRRC